MNIKSDIEIAQEHTPKKITEVAATAGIDEKFLELYGNYKAKVDIRSLKDLPRKSKLVLVTAISPTPAGEGKTTTSVGLADALNRLGKRTIVCLREPSLGPVFGVKGGAAGGGHAQVIPMEDIKPRKLAVTLSRYVTKTPAGIGLGIPETMEMALRECGTLRILFAAFCSVIGKLFRRKGWFYIVAGPKARGIDGPTEGTIPPYDHYVVLTPADPMGTSRRLAQALGHPVAIVDINDLGANILGCSQKEPSMALLARILGDNPLGQSSECTPMGIIRKV